MSRINQENKKSEFDLFKHFLLIQMKHFTLQFSVCEKLSVFSSFLCLVIEFPAACVRLVEVWRKQDGGVFWT